MLQNCIYGSGPGRRIFRWKALIRKLLSLPIPFDVIKNSLRPSCRCWIVSLIFRLLKTRCRVLSTFLWFVNYCAREYSAAANGAREREASLWLLPLLMVSTASGRENYSFLGWREKILSNDKFTQWPDEPSAHICRDRVSPQQHSVIKLRFFSITCTHNS